jgi:pyruvate kinase
MRRHRKGKIVATLGPASGDEDEIRALFEGADVFRSNFSHGAHQDHQARYDIVRRVERETGRPIAVLADLQGPKLGSARSPMDRSSWRQVRCSVSTWMTSQETKIALACRIRRFFSR